MNPATAGRRSRFHPRGSALVAALCLAAVLAIALASYLTLCTRTMQLSTRNVSSTHSTELAELGIEDALWSLNRGDWSTWTTNVLTGNATKTLGGFSYENGMSGAVSLLVTNYATGPRIITVTGTTTLADGTTTSRTLTANTNPAALFVNAVAATTGLVKFSAAGTASLIDSYDSSVGTYAAQVGSAATNYSAVLASGSTSTAAATVQLTNAQVRGYVATVSTGPSYSSTATLKGPNTLATTKIDSSRISTSPYQPLFDLRTPSGSGTTLSNPAGNITLGTAGSATPTIYYCSGLNLTGTVKITIAGPVQIVMTGASSFYIGLNGGTPSLEIASTGNASLEVFSAGDIAIYGNGINNLSLDPKKCAIYSSNGLTVPDMQTGTAYYGVIYTPTGDFTVRTSNAIYGAIVARNVTFTTAAPQVHYDANLKNVVFPGIDTPYAAANIREP